MLQPWINTDKKAKTFNICKLATIATDLYSMQECKCSSWNFLNLASLSVCRPGREMWLPSMWIWDAQKNIPQRWLSTLFPQANIWPMVDGRSHSVSVTIVWECTNIFEYFWISGEMVTMQLWRDKEAEVHFFHQCMFNAEHTLAVREGSYRFDARHHCVLRSSSAVDFLRKEDFRILQKTHEGFMAHCFGVMRPRLLPECQIVCRAASLAQPPPSWSSFMFPHLLQGGMGAALLSDPDKIEAVSADKRFQSLFFSWNWFQKSKCQRVFE